MKKSLPTCAKSLLCSTVALGILAVGTELRATVTLEIQFENGMISGGSLAAIVADTADDGFTSLTDPSVSGTLLSTGSTIGTSDDLIITVFNASTGPEWASGAGFADTFTSLEYSQVGISEGMALAIYVFPGIASPGSLFILGDEFVSYSSTTKGGSGGTIPFVAPPDPGVYAIAALTNENGGTFDPMAPTMEEAYRSGNAGATGEDGNDDIGNSRSTASSLTVGSFSGELTDGDLDFFKFVVTETSIFSAALNAGILADAWVFDENGNIIYSPDGSSPFQFEQTLEPGTYYIALRGRESSSPSNYSLNLSRRGLVLILPASPDLTIGKSPGEQRGLGVISASGVGQSYITRTRAGKKVRSFFSVRNQGNVQGFFHVKGPSKHKFYNFKYRSTSAGNITAAMKRGGFLSAYPANGSIFYRLDLKPTKEGRKRGKSGKFKIDSSGGDSVDRGKVKVKVRKK